MNEGECKTKVILTFRQINNATEGLKKRDPSRASLISRSILNKQNESHSNKGEGITNEKLTDEYDRIMRLDDDFVKKELQVLRKISNARKVDNAREGRIQVKDNEVRRMPKTRIEYMEPPDRD